MAAKRYKRNDQPISVRLIHGSDDDLIVWWNGIESGTGSAEIKEALRAYIARNENKPNQSNEIGLLRQTVERMAEQISGLVQQISRGVMLSANSQTPPAPVLDESEVKQRSERILKQRW